MIDFIVGAIIIVVVGLALAYIIKSRKKGVKCIGCPDAKTCCAHSHAGGSTGGCGSQSCSGCGSHADVK